MYDYLGGEQVKLFYEPIFYEQIFFDFGDSPVVCSGGSLTNYDKAVPYRSIYYNYGKNFVIFDICMEDTEEAGFIVVEDSKYINTYSITNLPKKYWEYNKYSYNGRLLNILSIDMANKYIKASNDRMEEYYAINQNDILSFEDKMIKLEEMNDKYKYILSVADKSKEEKYFGQYLYLYIREENDDIKEKIASYFKKYINNEIVKKYKNWLGSEDLISFEVIDKIICEINLIDILIKKNDN